MTVEILTLLLLLACALVVFLFEWLPVDLVALLLVLALVLTGVLTPAEAFSGFADEVIVILASIFVLSGALVRTGVMEWLAGAIYRVAGRAESRVVAAIATATALLSAFFSNTNVTAVLLPGVLGYSRERGVHAGRLLIPLAYASMLGGTCTLVGTSTNLAASGMFDEIGLEPLSVFELAPVGAVMVVVGVAYLALVGRRLLPARGAGPLSEQYHVQDYLAEIVVGGEAELAGKSLEDSALVGGDLNVLAIMRRGDRIVPRRTTRIEPGDLMIVQGPRELLLDLETRSGIDFEDRISVGDEELRAGDLLLAEAIVMPRSAFVGRTLRELDFRRRYGPSVLAIHRRGESIPIKLQNLPLEVGDVLLLQGSDEALHLLQERHDLWLLGEVSHVPFRRRKGLFVLGAGLAAVVSGTAGWLPLSVAFLLAAVAVVLTRCVRPEKLYEMIEWRVLILIGGMTSFGLAMAKTGAAPYLAGRIVDWMLPLGVLSVLGALVALTMVLTQPMSNAAAALVVLPVAVSAAREMGVDPRSVAILVTLAASLSFIAPFEPACLLVYGPGRYRFRDFVKAGLPLTLIAFVLLLILVPWVWPLG
ncbi:MAG: SLC13 family permease [Acidobacteriota bacterium]|jgi:di/tricarboxylate transporter